MARHLNCIERYARRMVIGMKLQKLKWTECQVFSHCCPYGKCGTNLSDVTAFWAVNSKMTKRNRADMRGLLTSTKEPNPLWNRQICLLVHNVCYENKYTKCSSVLLLHLVYLFLERTLTKFRVNQEVYYTDVIFSHMTYVSMYQNKLFSKQNLSNRNSFFFLLYFFFKFLLIN